jgi:cephalosporin hydroxylase
VTAQVKAGAAGTVAAMRDVEAGEIEERFARLYYDDEQTWRTTFWQGVQTAKCPLDLWIFQEIITDTGPDLIIEAGTHMGGSALFLASLCDIADRGEVITIDVIAQPGRPAHPRITYLQGSSTDDTIVEEVSRRAAGSDRVMVILDSDHTEAHVFDELTRLGPLVTPGCYLIVEDTIVNGHPVLPDFGPGPGEAVSRYLAGGTPFVVDRSREKFHLTFNPGGYLRRTEGRPT